MEIPSLGPQNADSATAGAYASRSEALERRVNAAAQALSDRGIRPTVTRIRAALGGGSPNDLAPALKRWKESAGSNLPLDSEGRDARPRLPIEIADLAHELWQRANAAAAVELKGGTGARANVMRSEAHESLRGQVSSLRDQLQRESLAFGELRAQAARYEAMAHHALARVEETEARERKHLRELGTARQRIAELEAAINQLQEERSASTSRSSRRRTSVTKTSRSSNAENARRIKKAGAVKSSRRKAKLAARAIPARRRPAQRRSR